MAVSIIVHACACHHIYWAWSCAGTTRGGGHRVLSLSGTVIIQLLYQRIAIHDVMKHGPLSRQARRTRPCRRVIAMPCLGTIR